MTVVSEGMQETIQAPSVVQCICCPCKVSALDAWYFMGIRPEVDRLPAEDSFGPFCKVCYEQLKAVIQLALRPPAAEVTH